MNTLKRQRGMSKLAMLVIAVMVGVFVMAGIKLTPAYLQYYSILGIIDNMQKESGLGDAPKSEVVSTFRKRLSISSVDLDNDSYTIKKVPGKKRYTIEIDYEVRQPLFGNLSLVVSFNRVEEVGGG